MALLLIPQVSFLSKSLNTSTFCFSLLRHYRCITYTGLRCATCDVIHSDAQLAPFNGISQFMLAFFTPFYSFCSSDWMISSDLCSSYLILSSAWSGLLLKLSSKFFSSINMFFNSRISVCFPSVVSLSLLNFSFVHTLFS